MSHTITAIQPLPPGLNASTPVEKAGIPKNQSFLTSLDSALKQVSQAQEASVQANQAVLMGKPGASLENALIASAQARIGWNATVAVRNNVVNAYKTIMNMPV